MANLSVGEFRLIVGKLQTAFPGLNLLNTKGEKQTAFPAATAVPDMKHPGSFLTDAGSPIRIDGDELSAACWVSYRVTRHVEITPVQGRDHGFLETSSLEPYAITIKGIATSSELGNEGYPYEWADLLRSLNRRSKESLEIENDILNRQGIRKIVIRSVDVDNQPGVGDWFAYKMNCVNDFEADLELWESGESKNEAPTEVNFEGDA